jgi:hypothetical protein
LRPALNGTGTRTLQKADQKYVAIFELWCCRRVEKIIWTDLILNEEVLLRIKEQRNILHEISKRKANWIGHILCRNCLLKHFTEENTEGKKYEEDEISS